MEPTGCLVDFGAESHEYLCDRCLATAGPLPAGTAVRPLDADDLREEAYWCEACDALLLASREGIERAADEAAAGPALDPERSTP